MLNPYFKEINLHIDNKFKINNNFNKNLLNFSKIKLVNLCLDNYLITDLKIERFIQKLREYLLINRDKIQPKVEINKQEELNKLVKFETNKQLNQFSKIYFSKVSANYFIDEK